MADHHLVRSVRKSLLAAVFVAGSVVAGQAAVAEPAKGAERLGPTAAPSPVAGGASPVFSASAIVPPRIPERDAGLALDPALIRSLPDTPETRAMLQAHTERLLQIIGERLNIPSEQRPHYRDLMEDLGRAWLQNLKQPEAEVAALLSREREQRERLALESGSGVTPRNDTTNMAALALAPYLDEAGLCAGEVFGKQGLVCSYLDEVPGSAGISGTVRTVSGGTTDMAAFKAAPRGSGLERVLALSRLPQQASPSGTVARNDLLETAKVWLGRGCRAVANGLLPAAQAQDSSFSVDQCTTIQHQEAATIVVRVPPYLLGMLMFSETVGRVVHEPDAPWNQIVHINLADTLISEVLQHSKDQVKESLDDSGNRAADQRARRACRDQTGQAFQDCYIRVYKDALVTTDMQLGGVDLLTAYMKWYALAQVKCKVQNTASCPANKPWVPFLKWAALNALSAVEHSDIYGEAYVLATVQYGATSADQVFVVAPFGFTCTAFECKNVVRCAVVADDLRTCASQLATLKDWELRPRGGYIEHSINSCMSQAVPYAGRLGYRGIRANETSSGKSGLPYDVTIKSSFQVAQLYAEPNNCEASQIGDPVNQANTAQGRTIEHTCPFPSSKQGPTDPTPPLGVTGADGVLAGTRPPEQIPSWTWSLGKITSDLTRYTAIYAGLDSTKLAYDAARNPVPGVPLPPSAPPASLLPDCTATRTFRGVTSKPGHAFWAYHGEEQSSPQVSPESILGAAAFGGISYYELLGKCIDGKIPYCYKYAGFVAVSASAGTLAPADKANGCSTFPISETPLCGGTDDRIKLFLSAGRDGHAMPEVNIVMADTLDHPLKTCGLLSTPAAPTVLQVFGRSLDRQDPNAGDKLRFLVQRNGSSVGASTVNYNTVAGSDSDDAKPNVDYRPVSGSLGFAPGETAKWIEVQVLNNPAPPTNPSKKVYLRLSDAQSAKLPADPVGVGAIIPNVPDLAQGFLIAPLSSIKRPVGRNTGLLNIQIQRLGLNTDNVTLNYKTQNGTATAGSDYKAASGKIVMAPGVTLVTIPITVYGNSATDMRSFGVLLQLTAGANTQLSGANGTSMTAEGRITP